MKAKEFFQNDSSVNYISKTNNRNLYIFRDGNAYEVELVRAVLPISDTEETDKKVQYEIRYKGNNDVFPVSYEELSNSKSGATEPNVETLYASELIEFLEVDECMTVDECGYDTYAYVFAPDKGLCKIAPVINKIEFDYNENKLNILYTDEFNRLLKYYKTEKECLDEVEFDVFDKEGNFVEHYVGLKKRMEMSDKQRKLVDKLNKVLDECRDNQLEVIFDHESSDLYILNIAPLQKRNNDEIRANINTEDGLLCKYDAQDIIDIADYLVDLNYYGTDIDCDFHYCVGENAEEL